VNIGGTALMLDILANQRSRVERVVVASSRSVYGEGRYRSAELGYLYPPSRSAEDMAGGDFRVKHPGCTSPIHPVATDEESKIHPSSVYGITKQVQEQLVMTVCPSIGIEGVAFRYHNVFGPGQSLSNPYTGILSIFANQIMNGEPIDIFEDGTESRDFIFIDDAVEATVLGVEEAAAAGQVFNVGTGVPVSVLTAAETLSRLLGADVPMSVTGNFRLADIRHNYSCTDKIERLLGFRPTYDFERGLAEFAVWALASGPKASDYETSREVMHRWGPIRMRRAD
jgi:dTDP-L-rhamnose 4-epimerase